MKVGIGTKNPCKVGAVEEVFRKAFGDVEFLPVEVDSGVPAEPKEDQILEGAMNRAKKSLSDNDYGIGIEGGTIKMNGRTLSTGYCVIINKEGKYTVGSQPMFELPAKISKRIDCGEELGMIEDDVFEGKNIKQGIGAVGMLSNSFVTRGDLIRASVSTALIPLIGKKIYSE